MSCEVQRNEVDSECFRKFWLVLLKVNTSTLRIYTTKTVPNVLVTVVVLNISMNSMINIFSVVPQDVERADGFHPLQVQAFPAFLGSCMN